MNMLKYDCNRRDSKLPDPRIAQNIADKEFQSGIVSKNTDKIVNEIGAILLCCSVLFSCGSE